MTPYSLPGLVKDLGLKYLMPEDLNIKPCMLLLSKLSDFFNATFEALVAGRAQIYKAPRVPPKPANLAPALGGGGLEG